VKKYGDRGKKSNAYRPHPPFAIVEGAGTPAFKCLSPTSVWVLLKFYEKFNGLNRNNLSFTYDEASSTISERVYNRSLWELRAFGFLDVVRQGRLERICTIFALSDRWRRFKDPDDAKSQARLLQIRETLKEIESLKREKWTDERKSEKRQHMNALRRSLLEAR
jgi:hypothetical protein